MYRLVCQHHLYHFDRVCSSSTHFCTDPFFEIYIYEILSRVSSCSRHCLCCRLDVDVMIDYDDVCTSLIMMLLQTCIVDSMIIQTQMTDIWCSVVCLFENDRYFLEERKWISRMLVQPWRDQIFVMKSLDSSLWGEWRESQSNCMLMQMQNEVQDYTKCNPRSLSKSFVPFRV